MAKLPIIIGYPLKKSNAPIHNTLKKVLFEGSRDPEHISDIVRKFSINSEILTTNDIPVENLYTNAKPEPLSGRDLFVRQYSFSKSLLHRWVSSDDEFKRVFYDDEYVNHSYQTSLDLWRGREIVSFLKRFSSEWWNPYFYSGLKPWEIIMDKLQGNRSKTKTQRKQIDGDYYDKLIRTALNTRGRFLDTPEINLHRFLLSIKPQLGSPGYHRFIQEQVRKGMVPHVIGYHDVLNNAWDELDVQTRQSYSSEYPRITNTFTKDYCKMLLVLHYIYDVQGSDFDWRDQLKGDYVYYNGSYLKYLFYVQKNHLQHISMNLLVDSK